ncbi:MAG: glycosyltransferase family 4 protein [Planctomycetota bacterium]
MATEGEVQAPSRPFVFIAGTDEPGGVHVHTVDVARALVAVGHKVSIVCPSVDYFSPMLVGADVQVEVVAKRQVKEGAMGYWRQHLARYREATAVLCRGELAQGSLGDLAGIRLATRSLYIVDHRNLDGAWARRAPAWVHGLFTGLVATRLIGVSHEITATARSVMRMSAAKTVTCVNWVAPAFAESSPTERSGAQKQLGLSPDSVVVGYHGRLGPEKRVDVLVRAVAAMNREAVQPFVVVVVGDGWKRESIEQLTRDCGVTDCFRFVGWHPDPAAAVAAFDIAVLPSLAEGFPLGLMEAMARGAACLAHPMSSTEQLLRNGTNGVLADLTSPQSFATALECLIEMPAPERRQLGDAAAATIRSEYTRSRRLPDLLQALGVEQAARAVEQVLPAVRALHYRKSL